MGATTAAAAATASPAEAAAATAAASPARHAYSFGTGVLSSLAASGGQQEQRFSGSTVGSATRYVRSSIEPHAAARRASSLTLPSRQHLPRGAGAGGDGTTPTSDRSPADLRRHSHNVSQALKFEL